MKIKIDNILLNYEFINNNKEINTIILPGWMNNHKTYECLYDVIGLYSNIYVIDFPGFGISSDPEYSVNLDYYVEMLNNFIELLNIKNIILFGHSFGCRVAIKYQGKYKQSIYLVLTAAAGIKRFSCKNFIKIRFYKIRKKIYKIFNTSKYINLIQTSGSKDYVFLNDIMKGTFQKIIHEDLKKECRKIKCPTLLIWGVNDSETKIKDGILINKLIKSSSLVKISYAGHFPFIENKFQYMYVLNRFYQYIMGELLLT